MNSLFDIGDAPESREQAAAPPTVYAYDAAGTLTAEYSTTAPSTTGTLYLTGDHLGSTRVVTSAANTLVNGVSPGAAGTVVKCYDYMPFGEDIPSGVESRGSCYPSGLYPATPDAQSVKFTGKERDAESGLDHYDFRYMSSGGGRSIGADPENAGASLTDPQNWNAYAYVRNSPLRLVDPHGLSPTCYLEGFATDCGQTAQLVSAGAAVQCPNNVCVQYDSANGFQQFVAGAGGASGYVNFSDLGQLNEWQGKILNNSQFYSMQVSQPAFQQQLKLEISKLAAYLGVTADEAAKLISANTGLTSPDRPQLQGGNWNFFYNPNGYTTLAVDSRVPGAPSLHLHAGDADQGGPFSHVDTADPFAASGSLSIGGLLQHFFVDVLFGNTVYSSTGIPRP